MLYSAGMRSYVVFITLMLWIRPLSAQSTEADLKVRLLHKPLYLRGQWAEDRMVFDSIGHLVGTSDGVPFTTSGVEIKSIKLDGRGLKLEGDRVAVIFDKDKISRKNLEKLQIRIQAPANGNYGPGLDQVFTDNVADFVPTLPSWWQTYGQAHFLPGSEPSVSPDMPLQFKRSAAMLWLRR